METLRCFLDRSVVEIHSEDDQSAWGEKKRVS